MLAEFITTEDPRWARFLKGTSHDVYHLPEYVALCGEEEDSESAAFYVESKGTALLAPLLIRKLPDALDAPSGWRDASSPYGYPTPLLSDPEGFGSAENLFATFRTAAAEANIVTAFLRLHPLLPLGFDDRTRIGDLVRHGDTVAVDLTASREEMWSQTRANHRSDINKLRRREFTVRIDDWSYFGEFQRIYRLTMQRVDADDYYRFADSYFAGLRNALGEGLHLITVLSPNQQVAAAGLFTGIHKIVEYHLGATNPDFYRDAPSKLMFDAARQWGSEHGFQWLHLGGGLGGRNDSLFHFKAGFSALQRPFHTLRIVSDPEAYDRLQELWTATSGRHPEGDFFPSYRQDPAINSEV